MFKSIRDRKFKTIITELEKEAEVLTKKFNSINSGIEKNEDSNPNLYEVLECICDFGELCRIYNSYYEKYNAYPIVEKDAESLLNYAKITSYDGVNRYKATHYAVAYLNPNLKEAKLSLDKMINLRQDHELFSDPTAQKLIQETYKAAVAADFLPEAEDEQRLRKNILSKCGKIYNFIYQEQTKNPNYIYDNQEEFKDLQKFTRNYEFLSKYAQFSNIINNIIDVIEQNYLYSENKENTYRK